mmetsp:Transcript_40940/g.65815  ORF Transcript_40940/g.65815 Transcript_40940/m.65815 type:complete len:87 (-) Transcript_40940:966-1226(-)
MITRIRSVPTGTVGLRIGITSKPDAHNPQAKRETTSFPGIITPWIADVDTKDFALRLGYICKHSQKRLINFLKCICRSVANLSMML